jgi:hypothetical protein
MTSRELPLSARQLQADDIQQTRSVSEQTMAQPRPIGPFFDMFVTAFSSGNRSEPPQVRIHDPPPSLHDSNSRRKFGTKPAEKVTGRCASKFIRSFFGIYHPCQTSSQNCPPYRRIAHRNNPTHYPSECPSLRL